MKENLTELVFILDRSGSMAGKESDTIGGFNAMLEKQKALPGDCRITTVLFDDQYEIVHDRIDLAAVSFLTKEDYFVRGSTALLDAIGNTIHKLRNVQKNSAKEYRANKILFVIITDGMENASREFQYKTIRSMVSRQRSKYKWEFLFLGANIDAFAVARNIGIRENRVQSYRNDAAGIKRNFEAISDVCYCIGEGRSVADDWGAAIEEDFKSRKAK